LLGNDKYKNGQKIYDLSNDYLIYYFKDGTLKAEGSYKDEAMEGEWKFYRSTGQLWQIGNFLNNKKHGQWIRYNRDGIIEYDELFENGNQL
jgi:antitoxin component YwqK of YwqJK toxin-antitoxin module